MGETTTTTVCNSMWYDQTYVCHKLNIGNRREIERLRDLNVFTSNIAHQILFMFVFGFCLLFFICFDSTLIVFKQNFMVIAFDGAGLPFSNC